MHGNPIIGLASLVGATWAWVLYGFLAINTLPILVALLAGPRPWTQGLALVTVQIDLYLLVIPLGAGPAGFFPAVPLLPIVIPYLILLTQLVILLFVCRYRLHIKSFPVKVKP